MIAKKYRLSERELKKVFRERKPFFSSMMVANVRKNNFSHARVGILLSGKNTPGSVNRNAFRRLFYKSAWKILESEYMNKIVSQKSSGFGKFPTKS